VSDTETPQLAGAAAMVEHLAKSLVDEPDAVGVVVDDSHPTPRINVTAGDGEIGRLIGKRGRTAIAIRAVGRAVAAKDDAGPVDIEFLD
jgi:predicted RNA-binding protein YlqC (UPF0109 family)